MSLNLTYARVFCKTCGATCASYQITENVEEWAASWAGSCPEHPGGSR